MNLTRRGFVVGNDRGLDYALRVRMTACPSDDLLGAHVERALAEPEAAMVTSHLEACAACRQIVIAAVRAGVSSTPPTIAIGTPTMEPVRVPVRAGLEVGSRIGRYELRELLGAGGMGEVYRAYDGELDRSIALKVMRPELVGLTAVLAERLVRESRMMAKLAHPSVITVYDVGRTGDAVFIAMELIRGETLGSYVRRVRPRWRELVAILERAGQGLAAAHEAGIIHRDFKPDNVLVELDGDAVKRVVVTDFGVARTSSDPVEPAGSSRQRPSDPQLTATGTTVGTPAYMAPEQLAGQPLDARADIFAFAVSAWELLFGERPFPGKTVDEIRAAMPRPLHVPRGEVPARVVAVLARALAFRPEDRQRDIDAVVRALVVTRTRRRTVVIGAGIVAAVALVGTGIVGSRMLTAAAPDPCERGLASLDAAYDVAGLQLALAGDPAASAVVLARLDRAVTAWRATHRATCTPDAEPPQAASTAACLDARRLELASVVDDLVLDGRTHARFATRLVRLVGDPSACAWPAPGLMTARVPADPVLRRKVTALRYRTFDAEEARDRGAYKDALESATAIVAEARSLWAPAHAESLYVLGTAQTQGGDHTKGIATLQEAAAVAERAHHDYIAASSWIQLVQTAAFDSGDPQRGLEYATYAEAAVERIGRKPDLSVMLEYARGSTLARANRNAEAETALRTALALAERGAPELLPTAIQGLGFVLEGQGNFVEAVAMYRKALAELAQREQAPAQEIAFRERLAACLNMIGHTAEAELEARKAVELADRILDVTNLDRAIAHASLAQVLQSAGKPEAALAEAAIALERIGKINGERSVRYAEALMLVALILNDLERFRDADAKFTRACEILTYEVGDDAASLAECRMHHAIARSGLGDNAGALELAERVLPIFVDTFGEVHPQVATAYVTRGALHAELGNHAKAIADLERAIATFEKQPGSLDPGHLAAAQSALGQELWKSDRARGRTLVEQAVERFEHAAASWQRTREDARTWLASHRR